jgi:hypothetical protein
LLLVLRKRGNQEVLDYYGSIEYIGKDSYGHFHKPPQPQQYIPYRPLGSPSNRAELDGVLTQRFELQGTIPHSSPLYELDSGTIEGLSPSTEVFDRDLFDRRYQELKEFVKDFLVEHNSSTLEKLSLGYETVNNDITAI